MTDPLRILFASDLHFGHPDVNQEEMAAAFSETVFPLLAETDIFFINGDFFDGLIIFDSHRFDPIYATILNLFGLCEQHQIVLRILQGTWSHDRNQCERFEGFYQRSGFTFNYRFANGIEFEEIPVKHRSLRVLFIPDDLNYKSSDAIAAIAQEKLEAPGWDKIDYGCMHGYFDFTFPSNISQANRIVFSAKQFPYITKLIDVGHVHQHAIVDNAISNGSFDRTVHGDEDPKGCIRVFDYPDHYVAQFIENKNAAVYDTLFFTSDDGTEEIRKRITQHIEGLSTKREISLRFQIDTPEQGHAIRSWMREVYPAIKIKYKKNNEVSAKQALSLSALLTPIEKRIAPTPKTIGSFIRDHIPESYVLSIDEINAYLEPVSDK